LNECEYSEKEIKFCSKNIFLPWIKELWFNIFAIANNHSMDWGISGHNATIKSLEDNWISYFWSIRHWKYLDETYIFTGSIKGIDFAWHAYDFTIYGDKYFNSYCEDLKSYKDNWYVNFVVTHWWNEYQFMTHNKTQEQLAKKLIDCWANLIIWTHPHVIQDIEWYNWKPIIYSLWNFLFDQNWSENTKKWIWVLIDYNLNWEINIETLERNVSV
jgi:poly-gamma-glutamate synthesis protein (capsule biosynthesis protein)